MTKLTQLTQLLWLDVRELLSCCLSQFRSLNNYPCKGCAQTYKGEITARSSLDLIGCLTPTANKINANKINSRWQSREETISDTSTLQTQAPQLWSKMNYHGWARFNHSVITQIHCLILVYQQFRNWYWHPLGQFLCQVMVFQVPLKTLDNDCLPGWIQTGKSGKNKWVKQYAMIIIARCLQKFRNQNWRYGHRLNTN